MLVFTTGENGYDVLSTIDGLVDAKRKATFTKADFEAPKVREAVVLDGSNEISLDELFKDKTSIELAYMK